VPDVHAIPVSFFPPTMPALDRCLWEMADGCTCASGPFQAAPLPVVSIRAGKATRRIDLDTLCSVGTDAIG
jgi:hypothetical protein